MEKFISTPFAMNGDKNNIPDPIQTSGDVSMTTGYGYDYERDQTTDENAKNIERQKMNWLFYVITKALNEYQSLGVPDFITPALNNNLAYKYKKSAVVRYQNGIFISLVDDNDALPTDETKWSSIVLENSNIFNGYLKIDNLLSEIAVKGTPSQKVARKNIGIDGDIAYRDKTNTFNEKNAFKKDVSFEADNCYISWPASDTNACGMIYGAGLAGGALISFITTDELQVASTNRIVHRIPDVDKSLVRVGDTLYKSWNEGNLKPVKSVNNVKPDSNGNVNVTNGVLGVRLGTEITADYAGGAARIAPAGYVLTGLREEQGDNEIHTYYFRPIQQMNSSGLWVTVTAI